MTVLASELRKIHIEETDYQTGVSEAVLQKIGKAINAIIDGMASAGPVGTILTTMLSESDFQDLAGENWVLCDGQSCIASEYETVSGNSAVPDLRGRFQRMADHSSARIPDGTGLVGATYADAYAAHTHPLYSGRFSEGGGPGNKIGADDAQAHSRTYATESSGGAETRPKSLLVNYMIRID